MTRTGHHAFASARSLLVAGSILAAGALVCAGPAAAQQAPPAERAQHTADKPGAIAPREGCTDCRGAESARPDSSTVTTTRDGKTTVPKSLMRDQADFRLNEGLKNVPGVNRR